MVEAEFQKKHFWNIVCLLCGLFLIGLFVFAGYKDSEATLGDMLFGIVLGVSISLCTGISLFLNFRAYLSIEDGCIKGRYHYFGKIDCRISDVCFASGGYNTLIIQLKSGKRHTIMGIVNSWKIASVIRKNMPFEVSVEPEQLAEDLRRLKAARKKGIVHVCAGIALMFVNIFVTVFLTGARELNEFSKMDWTIMKVMGVVELATVIAAFYLANKTGKYNVPIDKLKYDLQRSVIETAPLLPGNAVKVFTDENYWGRVTVYGYPNDDSIYYVVEEFASDDALIKVYESAVYTNMEQLREEFTDLVDITEKVLH